MTSMSKALGRRAQILESDSGARSSRDTGESGLKRRAVTLLHIETMESLNNLESANEKEEQNSGIK